VASKKSTQKASQKASIFLVYFCLILISGCSWFEDNRIPKKLNVDITSPEYKETLSILINSEYFKMKIAELAIAQYYLDVNTERIK